MLINSIVLYFVLILTLAIVPFTNNINSSTANKISNPINFNPPINIEFSEQAIGATLTADFNNDGSADLIIAHTVSQKLIIYFGKSSENTLFDKSEEIAMSGLYSIGSVSSLAKADFDEDGLLDIVIGSQQCNNDKRMFIVARNSGNDHFSTGACLKITANRSFYNSFVYSIAIADFNEDSHQDIVISRTGNYGAKQVLIYFGNGDMTFLPAKIIYDATESKKRPYKILAIDVNKDGHHDLLIEQAKPTKQSSSVLYRGDGNGNFKVFKDYNKPWPRNYPDINLDNYPDKIVSKNLNTLIYFGNESGTFKAKPQIFSFQTTSNNQQLDNIIADFNGDSKPDILVFNRNRGENVLANVYLQSNNIINNQSDVKNRIKQKTTIEFKGIITAINKNSIHVNGINVFYSATTLINFEDGTGKSFKKGQAVDIQAYKSIQDKVVAIEIGVKSIKK